MSDTFLRPDGYVEWRPGPATVAEVVDSGRSVISRRQLCTACLVGDWPLSMFRFSQTLCDTCHALDGEVTRRASLDRAPNAGRLVQNVGASAACTTPTE
ncbi:hypothetical protein ACNHYB_00375 [Isoptericola jiangsuensis]|uniref:hypothetical protein n=1 Tax=Isoptericola jiangsuensis TaxID=548579 RepID=UPI003AAF4F51